MLPQTTVEEPRANICNAIDDEPPKVIDFHVVNVPKLDSGGLGWIKSSQVLDHSACTRTMDFD